MLNFAIGLVILSSVSLMFLAWFKICVLGDSLDRRTFALLLIIFGVCTVGGNTVLPDILSNSWDLIGQACLIIGIYIWIINDRRRL